MNNIIEFSTTSQDFNMTAPDDIASLKCGDTTISFLSSSRWFIVYKNQEDVNKQNIRKFLEEDNSNTLNVFLQGAGSTCNIYISENVFKVKTSFDCGNFQVANSLSCYYDFENNRTEITKFLNYLNKQYETKTQ